MLWAVCGPDPNREGTFHVVCAALKVGTSPQNGPNEAKKQLSKLGQKDRKRAKRKRTLSPDMGHVVIDGPDTPEGGGTDWGVTKRTGNQKTVRRTVPE